MNRNGPNKKVLHWWICIAKNKLVYLKINKFIGPIRHPYKFRLHRNDHKRRHGHLQTQTTLFIIKCDIVFTWNAANCDQKPHQFWQHMSTHLLYFRCSIRQLNTKQPLRHFRNEFIVILFYYSILRLSLGSPYTQCVGYRACVHFSQFGLHHHELLQLHKTTTETTI